MNLIKSFITNNTYYKQHRKLNPSGLMLHSVGCAQPSAKVFVGQFNSSTVKKAVHGFIEATGDVYQTLPWDFRAPHCGGPANNTHIGVEMTEPSTIKYTGNGAQWIDLDKEKTKRHVLNTYNTAVELFANLCILYNLNPLQDGVILSHAEGRSRKLASAHADVEHIWSYFGLTMDKFRVDVDNKISILKRTNIEIFMGDKVFYGYLKENVTMAPVRAICEHLNIPIRWDNDNKVSVVDGVIISETDLIKGTAYVPLRKLMDLLGKETTWNGKTKTITIK